jgi:hypothetical protein
MSFYGTADDLNPKQFRQLIWGGFTRHRFTSRGWILPSHQPRASEHLNGAVAAPPTQSPSPDRGL